MEPLFIQTGTEYINTRPVHPIGKPTLIIPTGQCHCTTEQETKMFVEAE